VQEWPVERGLTPSRLAELGEKAVLSMEGISQVSVSAVKIDGRPGRAIEWRRTLRSQPATRGMHITVPLRQSVVTVFWYVREADWQQGRAEMERMVRTIHISR